MSFSSFPRGGYNQNHTNKPTKPKRIKNHNDPSVSFTHGLLGDVNFDSTINIVDVVAIINIILNSEWIEKNLLRDNNASNY